MEVETITSPPFNTYKLVIIPDADMPQSPHCWGLSSVEQHPMVHHLTDLTSPSQYTPTGLFHCFTASHATRLLGNPA